MSKKAQYSFQIRASHGIDEKIIYSSIFDFIFKENICTLMEQSFFHSFAIQTFSINIKHCVQTKERNPSPCTNPYFVKIFLKLLKIEFQAPAVFSSQKPLHCLQEVSLSKFTPLPMIKTS